MSEHWIFQYNLIYYRSYRLVYMATSINSVREIEILRLVAKGLTNGEIAHLLTISPNTVKVHLSNIYEKTARSRTEATMYGIEHGIIDVPGGAEAVEVIPPTRAELLRKHVWWIIPAAALVMVLIILTLVILFRPPDTEAQPLAALTERWQELARCPSLALAWRLRLMTARSMPSPVKPKASAAASFVTRLRQTTGHN